MRELQRHRRMEKALQSERSMLRHFIRHVILRIVFVGLWRIRVGRLFLREILCFMEVSLDCWCERGRK